MSRVRAYLAAFVTAMFFVVPAAAQAQTGTVAGRVFDGSTMRPLSGATVQVGERGAITGDDGRFLITSVPVGQQTVRATILGYATSETSITVTAGQTSLVDFQLTLEALAIQGIVVTGYGQQEERDLTGVIEAVAAEEFQTGRVVSPEQLIQGKVAGVQIIDSGEPGGGVAIRIRGGTSINASNEPLFVVDGVPLAVGGGISAGRNPFNFLNPADIESVTVLKDASAAAIYGSRGANGVIIIETVGGRAGAEMTYTGNVSGSTVAGSVDLVGVDDFRNAVNTFAPANFPLLGSARTDWRGEIERTGFGQEHTLGITGGTDASNYRISLNYLDQEAVIDGARTERIAAAFNFNQLLLNDRLKFEVNVRGSRNADDLLPGGVIGNATNFAPTQPVLDPTSPTGFYEWVGSPVTVPENPLAELALIANEGVSYRSLGGLNTEIDIPWVTGLTLTSNIGYDVTRAENKFFAPTFLKSQEGSGNPGTVSRSNNSQLKTLFDAYLNYKRPIGDNQDLELTGGYSYENLRNEFPSFFANGLSTDLLGTSGVPNNTERGSSIFVDESRLIAFFGRVNYSIDNKYLFTGSLRRDGSSRFIEDEQWGLFPSAAFAWRLIEEDFMADNDLFSDLKLRVSWGVTGNQEFANYQQYADYSIADPEALVQFGNRFIAPVRPSAADPGVKWEETTSYNFGVDFGIMNDRFTGSLEYYFKDTDDLIFTVPVAAGTNFSNFVTTNIGSLENQGIELTLNAAIIEAAEEGGFTWDGSFNLAYNQNELTVINAAGAGDEQILTGGIAGGVGSTIQVLQPGSPVNSFFTYRHIRENGQPIFEDRNGDGVVNDQDLYEDINGDGVINQEDRVVGENPAPDFIIGHSSYMTMGNWDLSFALRANIGNHVYNNVASDAGHYQRLQGQVPYSLHASVLDTNFETPQYFSDYYVEDASFLRMDNITLGYRFEGMGILDGARAFATIQNLFVLTGYDGIDPEAGVNGIDNNIFPRSRTFTAGLSLGF